MEAIREDRVLNWMAVDCIRDEKLSARAPLQSDLLGKVVRYPKGSFACRNVDRSAWRNLDCLPVL